MIFLEENHFTFQAEILLKRQACCKDQSKSGKVCEEESIPPLSTTTAHTSIV